MNADFINPFLEAAALVYNDILKQELVRGKSIIKKSPEPGHDIAILLKTKGDASGSIVFSLNIEAVYKIVRKLIPGATDETIALEYRDVMGEIANMITGNAMNIFLNKKKHVDISVPAVVDTRTRQLELPNQTTLGMRMYAPIGILEINICMDA
jgi:chemotaxis protein CheX